MSTNAKPTPTPWGIEQTQSHNWIGPMRKDGRKVAQVVCHTDREQLIDNAVEQNDANAELICRAVNSHQELIEACKALLEVTSCRSLSFCGGRGAVKAPATRPAYGKHPSTPCDCCVCVAAKEAETILARATGESEGDKV